MADLVTEYFVKPIWDRGGYNIVNTVIYAGVALLAALLIYKALRREKIAIDQKFILSIVPFILFGSTARVVTDAVDMGIMALHRGEPLADFVLNSHIYDYGYFTVTPGIYMVVGLLTIAAVFGFNRLKRPDLIMPAGALLWLSQMVLLAPVFKFYSFALLALGLALIGAGVGYAVLKRLGGRGLAGPMVVFSHALDGAATFTIIDIFGPAMGKPYFEQHVLSRAIGAFGDTMFSFFLIKVAFATAAVAIVERESEEAQEKAFVLLLLMIFGLAPGARDLLRMLAGV